MAKRPRKPRLDQYEAYKTASGWYLAAWRDHRGLTLDELAAEMESSKGFISDLETGAVDKDGKQRRYNRDLLAKAAAALDVTMGYLVDVNPFTVDGQFTEGVSVIRSLDERDQAEVFRLADTLARRRGDAA
jgi:transcriptional regulator with XRE-family HTH domain